MIIVYNCTVFHYLKLNGFFVFLLSILFRRRELFAAAQITLNYGVFRKIKVGMLQRIYCGFVFFSQQLKLIIKKKTNERTKIYNIENDDGKWNEIKSNLHQLFCYLCDYIFLPFLGNECEWEWNIIIIIITNNNKTIFLL